MSNWIQSAHLKNGIFLLCIPNVPAILNFKKKSLQIYPLLHSIPSALSKNLMRKKLLLKDLFLSTIKWVVL